MDQMVVQKMLREKLAEAQSKNAAYSLRAFAGKLGISAGPLSQILNGTRNISPKMANRFCEALLLDPVEKKKVLTSPQDGIDQVDTEEAAILSADQFQLVSEWYYFGILSLLQTQDFQNDTAWIAGRLGIRELQAKSAIERLLRLGMVEVAPGNKLVRTQPRYRTTDDVANLPARKAHFQTLEMAKNSLEKDPVELREFTAITMPTHLDKLPEAKALIRKFQKELCALLMSTPEKTDVYKLSIELFPLTQPSSKTLKGPQP